MLNTVHAFKRGLKRVPRALLSSSTLLINSRANDSDANEMRELGIGQERTVICVRILLVKIVQSDSAAWHSPVVTMTIYIRYCHAVTAEPRYDKGVSIVESRCLAETSWTAQGYVQTTHKKYSQRSMGFRLARRKCFTAAMSVTRTLCSANGCGSVKLRGAVIYRNEARVMVFILDKTCDAQL